MKKYSNNHNVTESTVVILHTGRGGRFHYPGFITFEGLGEYPSVGRLKIDDKINRLFEQENENGEVYALADSSGRIIVVDKSYDHYIETGEVLLDFDGTYDTWKSVRIENLSEYETQTIVDAAKGGDDEAASVVAYMLEEGCLQAYDVYDDDDDE